MSTTEPTLNSPATAPSAVPTPRPTKLARVIGYVERSFLLFSVYALSIGPMYWHWVGAREVVQNLWIAAFYEPLRRLGVAIPLIGEWLNWYVRLWIL